MLLKKKKRQPGARKVTVSSRSFPRAYDQNVFLPEIRLSGRWLETIGFQCGQPVVVLIEPKKITLCIEQ